MFEDVKALGKLSNRLFQTVQINLRKAPLLFHHIHGEFVEAH